MNTDSLLASVAEAHNSANFAQQITPSHIFKLELLRLPYAQVKSALRVSFAFDGGVVDQQGLNRALHDHERDMRRWRLDTDRWQAEMRALPSGTDGRSFTKAGAAWGIGGPRMPVKPDPARFAVYHAQQRELTTTPPTLYGRAFRPSSVFPGWPADRIADREQRFLIESPRDFAGLPVVDCPQSPALVAEGVAELARHYAASAAQEAAARSGYAYFGNVRVLQARWVEKETVIHRYLLRASIRHSDRHLSTEFGVGSTDAGGAPRLALVGEHLKDVARIRKLVTAAVLIVALFGVFMLLSNGGARTSRTPSARADASATTSAMSTAQAASDVLDVIGDRDIPPSTGLNVVAWGNVIKPDEVIALDERLTRENQRLDTDFYILFDDSHVPPEQLSAFTNRVARNWQIGQSRQGRGILVFADTRTREVRLARTDALESLWPQAKLAYLEANLSRSYANHDANSFGRIVLDALDQLPAASR